MHNLANVTIYEDDNDHDLLPYFGFGSAFNNWAMSVGSKSKVLNITRPDFAIIFLYKITNNSLKFAFSYNLVLVLSKTISASLKYILVIVVPSLRGH